jgi:hypothetical protein
MPRSAISKSVSRLEASTGRDSAPPNERGTSADLGADRESVVLRSSSKDELGYDCDAARIARERKIGPVEDRVARRQQIASGS